MTTLRPDILLNAYVQGIFPMATSANTDEIQWYQPAMRGQLPIKDLHIPRSLLKIIKAGAYDVRIDTNFEAVMRACAAAPARPDTWINETIIQAFCALHRAGFAHSVEIWRDESLIGGLYGIAIGGAFCGESMFSRAPNASKIALVHLCARLHAGGFSVLDTQFVNPHLEQFGVYEIPHEEYMTRLHDALEREADFLLEGQDENNILAKYLNARNQPPSAHAL